MDTDSFIVYVKTEDIYKYIAKMLKKDLTLQILRQINRYLKKKIKNWINEI